MSTPVLRVLQSVGRQFAADFAGRDLYGIGKSLWIGVEEDSKPPAAKKQKVVSIVFFHCGVCVLLCPPPSTTTTPSQTTVFVCLNPLDFSISGNV